jgi:hypothetical protein
MSEPIYIGEAWLEPNGTIIMELSKTSDGMPLHAVFTYDTKHPEYDEILRHVGGLQPGEKKPVLPFPE